MSDQALYLPAAAGSLFILQRLALDNLPPPPGDAQGAIRDSLTQAAGAQNTDLLLLVPPFADEMNNARRMYSALCRALLEQGISSLMFDLYGTGDSEGEFGQADWQIWLDDLKRVLDYAQQQLGFQRIHLLGLRSAALLIADYLAQTPDPAIQQILFWQPLLRGDALLRQFLRLRVAANIMLKPENQNETVETLRALARQQGHIEVAGYDISKQLLEQLDALSLQQSLLQAPRIPLIHWMELGGNVSPATVELIERLGAKSVSLRFHELPGKPFWLNAESELDQRLIQHSVQCVKAALNA